MKREILKMAKRAGVEISDYKSYKSDMGCQCFEFKVNDCGAIYPFDYGYYYGGGENKLLDAFSEFLAGILNVTQSGYNCGEYATDIL